MTLEALLKVYMSQTSYQKHIEKDNENAEPSGDQE